MKIDRLKEEKDRIGTWGYIRFSKLISRAISKIHKRRIFMTLLCVGEKMQ